MILFVKDTCEACTLLLNEVDTNAITVHHLPSRGVPVKGENVVALGEADFYNVTQVPCLVVSINQQEVDPAVIKEMLEKEEEVSDE